MNLIQYILISSIITGTPLLFLYLYEKGYSIYYKAKEEEKTKSSNKGR